MIIKNLENKLEDSKEVPNLKINTIESKRRKKENSFKKTNDKFFIFKSHKQ